MIWSLNANRVEVNGSAVVLVLIAFVVVVSTIRRRPRVRTAGSRSHPPEQSGKVHTYRTTPFEPVYLTRDDMDAVIRSAYVSAYSSGRVTDGSGTGRIHPDWSPTALRSAVWKYVETDHSGKVPMSRPIECVGLLIHPDGTSEVDHGELDHPIKSRTLARKLALLEVADELYLSRQDVLNLGHYNFYIPINHGYHWRYVHWTYPGWTWEELYPVLRAGAPLGSEPGDPTPRRLPAGAVGVLIDRSGRVTLDDGSLEHPAKEASWTRGGLRLSEHCVLSGHPPLSPVIIHAPHTSTHIPTVVRDELLVTDTELAVELAAMTDTGVVDVAAALRAEPPSAGRSFRPDVVTATMSRLVFDPERFAEGDAMEDAGLGLVYTRRADGTPLRDPLPPERLAWYQAQHRAYTASMERLVQSSLGRFGWVLIVDLHSYPSAPLGYEDPARRRPEVCVGTDPFHTPTWLEAAALEELASSFDVAVNTPFAGAYVPGHFHGSDPRVLSLMFEVRRDVLLTDGGVQAVAASVMRIVEAAAKFASSEVS